MGAGERRSKRLGGLEKNLVGKKVFRGGKKILGGKSF